MSEETTKAIEKLLNGEDLTKEEIGLILEHIGYRLANGRL